MCICDRISSGGTALGGNFSLGHVLTLKRNPQIQIFNICFSNIRFLSFIVTLSILAKNSVPMVKSVIFGSLGALLPFLKAYPQGLLYTGRARASLGRSSLGQFFRQCLSPHFLLWNLDFWYARSLGQNEKNWKKHFSKNWKLTFSGPSIDFWLFFSSLSLYWPQATPLDLQP